MSHTDEDRGPWFDRALATLRIAYGVTFLWAFLDKTFALGFHTGYNQDGVLDRFGDAAWINGGSPTEGFLTFGVPADNPFKDSSPPMAGQAWVDWLFMAGLLGIGVTLLLGVGHADRHRGWRTDVRLHVRRRRSRWRTTRSSTTTSSASS